MHLRKILKRLLPVTVVVTLKSFRFTLLNRRYKKYGRPHTQLETSKARSRRTREGFFNEYCNGAGLDIGYGGDLIAPGCRGWDFEDGDAQYLSGLENESFDYVYSGHTLEHMVDAAISLENWWRVLKPGGYLILYLPHRDLFEKRKTLPSHWNHDHKRFFLLDREEEPDTIGVIPLIARTLSDYEINYAKVCDEGFVDHGFESASEGEYSIEVVLKKNSA